MGAVAPMQSQPRPRGPSDGRVAWSLIWRALPCAPAERYSSPCGLVQTGAECTMTSTPTTENVRLTITVTPEVHETFQRLAKAGSMSLSRAMGEWLGDTVEAAQFMAEKMEQARAAPKIVMREMHAYALGLADETGALMERMKKEGATARAGGQAERRTPGPRPIPPSSNTGGKGTQAGTGSRGGKPAGRASK